MAVVASVESEAQQQPNWQANPVYTTVNLNAGFTPDPWSYSLQAGGSNSVTNMKLGDNCVGYINVNAPDVDLNFTGAGSGPLHIFAASDYDTTLVINAPDGRWYCNDDHDGLNPAVTFNRAQNGNYNIWVGVHGSSDLRPATLYISEITTQAQAASREPDWRATPTFTTVDLRAGFTPDPWSYSLQAGGSDAVDYNLGNGCVGYINASAPDVDLNFSGANGGPLHIYATSDSDTTLIVNAPDGRWYCNDDHSGLNPAVTFSSAQNGNYNIWVGVHGQSSVRPATLHISEIQSSSGGQGGQGGQSGSQPNWMATPTYTTANLRAGFTPDPWTYNLQAGGRDAVSPSLGHGCTGYINAAAPDVDLNYQAGRERLFIYASSNTDTTLVVNTPDGRWLCNDDFIGVDGGVEITNPQSGNYNIWVGTFSDTGVQPAQLRISEINPR